MHQILKRASLFLILFLTGCKNYSDIKVITPIRITRQDTIGIVMPVIYVEDEHYLINDPKPFTKNNSAFVKIERRDIENNYQLKVYSDIYKAIGLNKAQFKLLCLSDSANKFLFDVEDELIASVRLKDSTYLKGYLDTLSNVLATASSHYVLFSNLNEHFISGSWDRKIITEFVIDTQSRSLIYFSTYDQPTTKGPQATKPNFKKPLNNFKENFSCLQSAIY